MITGEIRVNEYLTLLKWQASNQGKDTVNPDLTVYTIKVEGIYGGHHPFIDEFDMVHANDTGHLGLVIKIHQNIAERTAVGLAKRLPIEGD